jgi:ankyrin repeat protein
MFNDIAKAKKLIAFFADVNCKNIYGGHILSLAASEGHPEMVELLLSKGADVNAKDQHDVTALHYPKNKEVAEILLMHGAIVDAKTDKGETPLTWIARSGIGVQARQEMLKTAEVLIAHGADVNGGPLYVAAGNNNIDMAKFLLAHGADVGEKGGWPLMAAIGIGDYVDMAKFLVENGADTNMQFPNGDYPLLTAAFRGNAKCIDFLLSKGADPNITNKQGNTALEYTAQSDYYAAAAEALLKHGANPNVRNKGGQTPLGYAAEQGSIKVVEVLLAYKADVNIGDNEGYTPLQGAIQYGAKGGRELVEMLVKNGANVKFANTRNGETALQTALMHRGDIEIVKLLIEHGADVNIASKYGPAPLLDAIRYGSVDEVELLIEHGADVKKIALDGIDYLNSPNYKEKIALLRKHGAN